MSRRDYIDIAKLITLPNIDINKLKTQEYLEKYDKNTNVARYYDAAKNAAEQSDLDQKNKFLWYTFVLICEENESQMFNYIKKEFENNCKKDENYKPFLIPYAKEWFINYQNRTQIKGKNINLDKRYKKKNDHRKKKNKRCTGLNQIQSPRSSIRHSV